MATGDKKPVVMAADMDVANGVATLGADAKLNDSQIPMQKIMAVANAAEYSDVATYALGAYCTRDGKLYRCTVAISTAEAWNAAHWEETTVGAELIAISITLANNNPRNWGLGGNAKLLTSADNLDNITQNGWYWWYDSLPSGAKDEYCHMRVDNGQTGETTTITQTIYRNGINSVTVRFYKGGAWITEYINPPMKLGVEYRTTERYLGKPVYTMAFNFGAIPINTYKIVAHNIANVDHMLPVYGVIPEIGIQIPGKSVSNGFWYNDIDVLSDRANTQVVTRNCNNYPTDGGWTATLTLRYTKTTD